jgi:hypothetical protein
MCYLGWAVEACQVCCPHHEPLADGWAFLWSLRLLSVVGVYLGTNGVRICSKLTPVASPLIFNFLV